LKPLELNSNLEFFSLNELMIVGPADDEEKAPPNGMRDAIHIQTPV